MTHNQHLNYRPDIDGLRAVAVLFVLIFHGFPNFIKGGFIGVDIFFVISGYLITSIILKSQVRGDFSLLEFYSRRIKRIFPALIVVLIFCLTFGWFSLLADEYQALGKHVAAGALYISNFVLQSESGYFDMDSDYKPLLHLWSLGIEEQFYLVFPLLLIAFSRAKWNPLVLISGGLIISFSLNIFFIEQNPTSVFFHPQSRVWELLIGSFVAYINLFKRAEFDIFLSKFNVSANILAWLGVALIFTAWIGLNKANIDFPSGWALLPTLGAAGLILAGEQAWFNRKFLSNKYVVWLGLISYPLYLWHWVLLALMRVVEMERPAANLRILALLMSVFLAWLTYYFVEKRLRFRESRFVVVSLVASLSLVGFIGFHIYQKDGYPNRFNYQQAWNEGEPNPKMWLKKWIAQKSCTEKFGIDEAGFCMMKDTTKMPTVVLIGDSHANHLYPALQAYSFKDENLLQLGLSSCPAVFDIPKGKCSQVTNKALEIAISTPSIHTVVLNSIELENFDLINEKKFNFVKEFFSNEKRVADTTTFFQQAERKTFQRLIEANKRVIFILDIPRLNFHPSSCVKRPFKISGQMERTPCAVPFEAWQQNHENYQKVLFDILKDFPQITVWNPTGAFCDDKYCWAVRDNKMLYRDENHLNEVGSLYLGNYLNEKYPLLPQKSQ